MAKLSLRATGTTTHREKITADNEEIRAAVYIGNVCVGLLEIRQHSDMHIYVRWYSNRSDPRVLLSWDGYSDMHSDRGK